MGGLAQSRGFDVEFCVAVVGLCEHPKGNVVKHSTLIGLSIDKLCRESRERSVLRKRNTILDYNSMIPCIETAFGF